MSPVVYVTNCPAPYKTGLFDAIAELLPKFTACYLTTMEYMRQWDDPLQGAKHPYRRLKSRAIRLRKLETGQYLSWDIFGAVFSVRPIAVIFAPYSQISSLAAMMVCFSRRIPVVIWYESHSNSSIAPGFLTSLGNRIKRKIFRSARCVIVPGEMAKKSASSLGVDEDRIIIATHAVDVQAFGTKPDRDLPERVASMLSRHRFCLLYIGQFIERKNVRALIEVFDSLNFEKGDTCLLLLGGNLAAEEEKENIVSAGYLQQEDVRAVLHACDGLILPSKVEVWGLVVNEALAAGKPVLVSSECGAAELIENGRNGLTFDPLSRESMKEAILGWRTACIASQWRPDEVSRGQPTFAGMAQGFVAAINRATDQERRGPPKLAEPER